jgi:hypothetical protein
MSLLYRLTTQSAGTDSGNEQLNETTTVLKDQAALLREGHKGLTTLTQQSSGDR